MRVMTVVGVMTVMAVMVGVLLPSTMGVRGQASRGQSDAPFFELQDRQAVTVLVHVSLPPFERGMTWSRDRSFIMYTSLQYCHSRGGWGLGG